MPYRQSLHIEAPVEKVFDAFRDPRTWRDVAASGVSFGDTHCTPAGRGSRRSRRSWSRASRATAGRVAA